MIRPLGACHIDVREHRKRERHRGAPSFTFPSSLYLQYPDELMTASLTSTGESITM